KGFIQFVDKAGAAFPDVVYKAEGNLEFEMVSTLQNALYNIKNEIVLQDLDLTDEQKMNLFSPINIDSVQISVGGNANVVKTESEMFMAYGMVYVLMVLLFMGIMITGQLIATEITAEKSSRI